jgi:hypothetical protein
MIEDRPETRLAGAHGTIGRDLIGDIDHGNETRLPTGVRDLLCCQVNVDNASARRAMPRAKCIARTAAARGITRYRRDASS